MFQQHPRHFDFLQHRSTPFRHPHADIRSPLLLLVQNLNGAVFRSLWHAPGSQVMGDTVETSRHPTNE